MGPGGPAGEGDGREIGKAVAAQLAKRLCEQRHVVLLAIGRSEATLAMANPLDDQTPNDVSALLGNVPVTVVTASAGEIAAAIARGFVAPNPKIAPMPVVERAASNERARRPLLLIAAVLAARPLRNAIAPVAVSLGGYQGKYLQWSVPSDIRFDAASQSFSDCDIGSENGVPAGYFKSWTDHIGDRYQQGPGQVDRLWILDIEGHRLLVDATYMPAATDQDRMELAEVVNSIAFKR